MEKVNIVSETRQKEKFRPTSKGFFYVHADYGYNRYAATRFEPQSASRAFPCVDDPSAKARFRVTVGRPADMVCLSNMPKEGQGQSGR